MFLIVIGALCLTLTSCSPLTNRIINGTNAPSIPWMADILTYYEPGESFTRNCGGSLIAPNWVLTAKHCIYNEQNNLTSNEFHVTLGSNSIFRGQLKKVIDIVEYNSNRDDDLILLKLENNVEGITPIKVQYEDNIVYAGKTVTIYGWGQTETNPAGDFYHLQQTNVTLISREECGDSRWVCFDPRLTHSNSCLGDSGGPMILEENGETRLIGVSHSITYWDFSLSPCDGPKSIYISTAHYASWIQSVII
ncbi:chymotrypsinogen A-like [Chrysoperla carnea]|uniref:chymotrypsinogen A-like n=1 Tax=Chrysoperla carnea TaxID=189513 RepID=UPI001D07FD28|nr:chymotrypsinogen A-like [Chrysoperla carnea]